MPALDEVLSSAIRRAPIVERNGRYDIHPDFCSILIKPDVVSSIVKKLISIGNFDCEKLVLIESMAIPVGTALALELGIPYTVVRKRVYNLPGEVRVRDHVDYKRADFHINGITSGQAVVVFDDFIDTGETLNAVIISLRKIGAEIIDVITVMDKGENRHALDSKLGIRIKTLVKVNVRPNGVDVSFEVDRV